MGYVIKEIYPTGGHTVTDEIGNKRFFRNEDEAERVASLLNRSKKDATRLFIVVPERH